MKSITLHIDSKRVVYVSHLPHTAIVFHSFPITVTLSGICSPLSSSPTINGVIVADLISVIFCPFFGREKSKFLMSVTKNACISMMLLMSNGRVVKLFGARPRSKAGNLRESPPNATPGAS